jgi:hypothetical protein
MKPELLLQQVSRASRMALCLSALCFAGSPVLSGQSILSEGFLSGQRLTQDLPNTSAWYGASGSLSEIPGGVRLDATSASRHLITYFTDSGVVSVGPGEILQATYQFQLITPQDFNTNIRVGLLNSGGSRISDDSAGVSVGAYFSYTGYGSFFNPVTEATDTHSIRQRTGENNGLLHVGTPWTNLSGGGDPISLAEDTLYTAIFSVNNTGSGLSISHKILAGETLLTEISHAATDNLVTGFDTFAIAVMGGAADRTDAIDLYSFEVAVVPEPSAYAALAGLLALGLVIARRRAALRK